MTTNYPNLGGQKNNANQNKKSIAVLFKLIKTFFAHHEPLSSP
tara:strand:- start:477 stop:605 length:129 start_codon:yes stop_codon:yes gene_type:complete